MISLTDKGPVGRLAPSPTGLLHLGNAWSFLLAWLGVRSHPSGAGRIILRQEDIDPARSRREWMDGIERVFKPGEKIIVKKGNSITLR